MKHPPFYIPKLLILASTAYAVVNLLHWPIGFSFFTQLSNLFLAAVVLLQLLFPKARFLPGLKFSAVLSIFVTFLVFLTVLGPVVPGGLPAAYAQDHGASFCGWVCAGRGTCWHPTPFWTTVPLPAGSALSWEAAAFSRSRSAPFTPCWPCFSCSMPRPTVCSSSPGADAPVPRPCHLERSGGEGSHDLRLPTRAAPALPPLPKGSTLLGSLPLVGAAALGSPQWPPCLKGAVTGACDGDWGIRVPISRP